MNHRPLNKKRTSYTVLTWLKGKCNRTKAWLGKRKTCARKDLGENLELVFSAGTFQRWISRGRGFTKSHDLHPLVMLWNPRPCCCGAEVLLTGADGLLCLRPWLSSLCFSHQGGCWHQCYYYRMVGSFSTSNVILINSSYCSHSLRQNLDTCWAMVSFLWITYVHLQNGVALFQSLWHWSDDTEIQHTLWAGIQFWWKRHTHHSREQGSRAGPPRTSGIKVSP